MTEHIPFEEVLISLSQLAAAKGAQVVLVGATARDIALQREGLTAALRATEDVDIAVAVAGLDAFAAVTSDLPAVAGAQHKFTVDGIEVDMVPFGDIESEDRTVTWPDGTVLNTLGLREAFDSAFVLGLGGGRELRVTTLAAQAALKLFAWADRSSWTTRDGADLGTIIEAYSYGSRLDTIYAPENGPLLAQWDFDVELVGAFMLGRDIRATMGDHVAASAAEIITEDQAAEMRIPAALRLQYPDTEALIGALYAGMTTG